MKHFALLALAGLTLCACGPKAPQPGRLFALAPADPRLAELYEGACKTCHINPASGAPLTHDAKAWEGRWKQGEAVMLDHVIQGYKGMPALGQCAACTPDDLMALTRFMAGREARP